MCSSVRGLMHMHAFRGTGVLASQGFHASDYATIEGPLAAAVMGMCIQLAESVWTSDYDGLVEEYTSPLVRLQ